ncbi:MAG: DsrE family protein [Bacteroidota bacterium]
MKTLVLVLFLLLLGSQNHAQNKSSGPIIKTYGPVYTIDNPSYPTETAATFKVVFDIMDSPDDPGILNAKIETAARFLNMHAQSGIPKEHMKVALVVHNTASKDIITNAAYRQRFGIDNPNAQMIAALLDADVAIILCGQSAASRNLPMEDLQPGVQLSLSAMTALIQLQNEDYRLIQF